MAPTNLASVIKMLALQAVEASKPCDIRYGEVISEEPLKVKISDNFILPESLILVPDLYRNRMETKNKVEAYQDWEKNTTEYTTTIETYQNDKSLKMYDNLILLREQGGRKYIVIGRF